MATMETNVLYYGDNLDILRHHIPDDSVDLIYLDPPFNSQATYNVLSARIRKGRPDGSPRTDADGGSTTVK